LSDLDDALADVHAGIGNNQQGVHGCPEPSLSAE